MEFTFQFFINICLIIGVSILVTRWVFQVGKTQAHLKAQTRLLAQMAAKQGVPEKMINSITEEIETDFTWTSTEGKEVIEKL